MSPVSPPPIESEGVGAGHLLTVPEAMEALNQATPLQLRKEAQDRPLRAPHEARDPSDRGERVRAIVGVCGQHEQHDARLRGDRRVAPDPRGKHGPPAGGVVAARVRVQLDALHVRAALHLAPRKLRAAIHGP